MKVKVSYTTEYEKVPKLIDGILDDCRSRLTSYGKLEFNIHRLEDFVRNVRNIQEDLSLLGDQLDDCVNLAVGYLNVAEKQNMEDEPPEFPVADEIVQQEPPNESH